MARMLITSGPTRQYLDPVRYLTNASSGRMGAALAQAAIDRGHEAIVVSGPVQVAYPAEAKVIRVVTTDEMLIAARAAFARCDGLLGAAAPCDYRPQRTAAQKIAKTGKPLVMELEETPDIVAALGREKGRRWVVGFALETDDPHFRAVTKLHKKRCDLIVLNGPEAINAEVSRAEVIDPQGSVVAVFEGPKEAVARGILEVVQRRLIDRPAPIGS